MNRHRFQQTFCLLGVTLLILGFQNCSDFQVLDTAKLNSSSGASASTIQSDPVLKSQAMAILQTKCSSCHQTASMGGITQILDLNHLVSSGLLVPGDPTLGRLVLSMQSGTMPPAPQSVTPTELTTITNWILTVKVIGPTPPVTGGGPVIPAGMTVASDAALKTQAMRVLQVNCAGCHQADTAGGITKIMDVDHIVSTGLVVMKDPAQGRLMGSIGAGTMPASGSRLALSAADRQTLTSWISSMSLVPVGSSGTGAMPLPTLAPTFQSISANILIPKCISCHGAARAESGIRYDSYAATVNSVSVNNANASKLYTVCKSGSMPDRPFGSLSSNELAAISMWINTGAGNN